MMTTKELMVISSADNDSHDGKRVVVLVMAKMVVTAVVMVVGLMKEVTCVDGGEGSGKRYRCWWSCNGGKW